MEASVFLVWSVDNKVDCSAAVVPKPLSLAGPCLTVQRQDLDGLGSQPAPVPSEKLGSAVRLLGLTAPQWH